MVKRRLGGHQHKVGGSGGLSAQEKKKKINQYMLAHNVGANEAKRRLHFKGVHPRRKVKQRTKHTAQVHQPGDHQDRKK